MNEGEIFMSFDLIRLIREALIQGFLQELCRVLVVSFFIILDAYGKFLLLFAWSGFQQIETRTLTTEADQHSRYHE